MHRSTEGEFCQLMALAEDVQPAEYRLEGEICTLGRAPTCQIVVPRRVISRLHARVERAGHRYVLHDAGSANGTFVNGGRLYEPHLLKHYDLIGLGVAVAVLRFVDPDPTFETNNRLRYDQHSLRFLLGEQQIELTPVQFRL